MTASPTGYGAALVEPERPAEPVELCERLYRGIFSSGLLVVAIMAGYSALLSAIRPDENRVTGIVVSLALLAIAAATLALRAQAYRALRLRPWLIALPAAIVGGGAWIIGDPNDQIFYVITMTLGVTGLTVRFSLVFAAAILAGVGCAAPALLSSTPHVTTTAVAAVTIPTVFWVIIEQLARYVLRAYGETTPAASPVAPAGTPNPSGDARRPGTSDRRTRRVLGGRLQRLLPVASARPRPPVALSARQLEVMLLCAEGLSHGEIAACLEIGPQQVRRQLREARTRTNSATSAALMAWGIRHGVLPIQAAPKT